MVESPYKNFDTYKYLLGLVVILVLITWVGLRANPGEGAGAWIQILVLMTVFSIVVGKAITGHWRGILIDRRNKMSLSRLQIIVWTLVVLSAIVAAVLSNVAFGWESPLEIDIPSQLWTLMGITTAAAVASPAILTSVGSKKVNTTQRDQVAKSLAQADAIKVDKNNESIVLMNMSPDDARWADLLKGDEVGNAEHVDVGKLQMFFFTFILAVGYGAAIAAMFNSSSPITALPPVDQGMNVLLGISQTGYLASKAVTTTSTA